MLAPPFDSKQVQTTQQIAPVEKNTARLAVSLGYDTEYTFFTQDGKEYQDCVTVQMAVNGRYPDLKHQDLIHQIYQDDYTAWVFKPPQEKLIGIPYHVWIESILGSVRSAMALGNSSVDWNLISFYSNAELALHIPDKPTIREFIKAQGEDSKLTMMPIQSAAVVTNFQLTLPADDTLQVSDSRMLTDRSSVSKIGDSLGMSKGDCDFTLHDAKWYLENDFDNFVSYGCRDSIISLKWYENFHDTYRNVVEILEKKHTLSKPEKLKNRTYLTVGSAMDSLMASTIEQQGLTKQYKRIAEFIENDYPLGTRLAHQNKGGLNKSTHGWLPTFIHNVDSHDINGAYATEFENARFSVCKPTSNSCFGIDQTMSLERLVLQLKYGYALVIVDEIDLPQDLPESHRILNLYDESGECVTALSNKDGNGNRVSQCFTQWELIAQMIALLQWSPKKAKKATVKVIRVLGWSKQSCQNPKTSVSFSQLIGELKNIRKKFKSEYGEKSAQQEVTKLLCNSGVGKTAQNKAGFDSDLTRECIRIGGEVNQTMKDSFKSKSYNPWMVFNAITGMVRCVTGLSLAFSNGYMAVTDSVCCPNGGFKDSNYIADWIEDNLNGDCYSNLAKKLRVFTWSREQENVTLQIYKERDYAYLKAETRELMGDFETKIKSGTAIESDLDGIEITKVAKRGYHQVRTKSEREKNVEFVLLGNKRFGSLPIHQKTPQLTKFCDMLSGSRVLNSSYLLGKDSAGMGVYNLKHDCKDLGEFDFRKRLKSMCRAKGYADQAHCEAVNPELLEKLRKQVNCRKDGNLKDRLPMRLRHAIAVVQHQWGISCRTLEKLTGIGKSSVNRIKQSFDKSKLSEVIMPEVMAIADNVKDLLTAIGDYFGKNLESLDIEGFSENCPNLHYGA